MTKRRNPDRPRTAEDDTRRTRMVLGCGALTGLILIGLLLLEFMPLHQNHPDGDHAHAVAPHGGILASAGEGQGHYHAEFVFGPTGAIYLYPLAGESFRALAAELQPVTADVLPDGEVEPTSVILRPETAPDQTDHPGTRFVGKLPGELLGRRLTVRVSRLLIAGEPFGFTLTWASPMPENELKVALAEEQQRIYLRPGGRYTEADVEAAGRRTAAEKFRGRKPAHDVFPRTGDRLCPVTRIKASRDFTWVVGGKSYQFCCAPCIDEFVHTAKEAPDRIEDPEEYVKGS